MTDVGGPSYYGRCYPWGGDSGLYKKGNKTQWAAFPPSPLLYILPPGSFPDPLSDGG